MRRNIVSAALLSLLALPLTVVAETTAPNAAVHNPAVAPAAHESIIQGKIVSVVPAKKEIYVMAGEKKHEYYFSDTTKIMSQGKEVAFSELKEGQKVKVTAHKVGKRLDPQVVELEG